MWCNDIVEVSHSTFPERRARIFLYVASDLKKTMSLFDTVQMSGDNRSIFTTSNICYRLFATARYTLNSYPKSIASINLE